MTRSRLPLILAGVAVIAGVATFLATIFGFGSPAILGIAPTALGLSLAFAFLSFRTRIVSIPLFVLGMAAATLTFVSWSVGFDEADAGVPRSPLGDFFIPAALITIVLLGGAVAFAVAPRLRMHPLGRALLSVAIGLLSLPFVIPLLTSGPMVAVAGVALMLVLTMRGRTATRSARPRASAGRGVRVLAIASLTVTVLSLGYGLVGGITFAGTDAATQAMGIMAAGGNLAAVPLMGALTRLSASGRLAPRIGLIVGGAGVTLGSVAWAAGVDLSQGLFLAIPAFVALWAGTMAASMLPYRGSALIGVSVVLALGAGVAYLMFVLTTAGALLAVISGFLAFGGQRLLSKTKEIGAETAV